MGSNMEASDVLAAALEQMDGIIASELSPFVCFTFLVGVDYNSNH